MIRRYTPTDADDAMARLIRQVDDLQHEVAALSGLRDDVAAHTRALARLADAIHTTPADPNPLHSNGTGPALDRLDDATSMPADEGDVTPADAGEAESAGEPVPAWLTVNDPALAIAWMTDLTMWVPAVWQPYLQTKTPDCWPWHPEVVAELLVVRYLWADAVVDDTGVDALAAWHDRWRPGAGIRVTRLMAGCDRSYGNHKVNGKEYAYDLACLDEVAHWWATTHAAAGPLSAPGLRLDDGAR